MDADAILNLQDCYSRTLLMPVVGSGISVPFGLPDWSALVEQAAEFFRLSSGKRQQIREYLDRYEFLEAVDVVLGGGVSEWELQIFVADCMEEGKRNADFAAENNYTDLARLSRIRFMTTNYDRLINDLVGADSFLLSELEKLSVNEFALRRYDHTVIPLHGEITRPESIVLSRKSYQELYEAADFEHEFQHLRTHYTFLFLGFSFEDVYFQSMFEKVLQRFEAKHYILFEEKEKAKNRDKIEKLSRDYGVEALYFDASKDGYEKAIHCLLEQIFSLQDRSVDTSSMVKLPVDAGESMSAEERRIVGAGRDAIQREALSELFVLYRAEYEAAEFRAHSISFQLEIVHGLAWYESFLQENEAAYALIQKELLVPEMKEHRGKLAFMQGQILWNLREYKECIAALEGYGGKQDAAAALLLDIVKCFQRFVPERGVQEGTIPVYAQTPRTRKEAADYRQAYELLKRSYVNPDTYNLLHLDSYRDRKTQQIAYYWLGVAAGQLFHEHEDAIQYLLRAYELLPSAAVCEELAENYLAKAEAQIRYCKNPKTYQVDADSLVKAKIRFQYPMNMADGTALASFYKRSGFAYLRTLYLLKDYLVFEDFYGKAKAYLQETDELLLLKAEVDAAYEHKVEQTLIDRLGAKHGRYLQYVCAIHRAEFFASCNPWESDRIYRDIVSQVRTHPEDLQDARIVSILLDSTFFVKDLQSYENLKKTCPAEQLSDMMELGFEDELYGRLDEAEKKMRHAFERHGDYGTFHILRGFYIRNHRKKDYDALYVELIGNLPGEMYRRSQFYMEYIVSEMSVWKNPVAALGLYAAYYDRFREDTVCRKELEEMLKLECADYSNFKDRVAWNRYMLTKAPKYARVEFYFTILKLYVANLQYQKAEAVLEEMRREGVSLYTNFADLIPVCIRKQKKKYYNPQGGRRRFSSDRETLDGYERALAGDLRFRCENFAAKGCEIVLSLPQLLCMFRRKRQGELAHFSKIYIMYAGVIQLQNSLWAGEDAFLRMVLQWLGKAENVRLAAPDFLTICAHAPKERNYKYMAEDIQLKLFCKDHPEVIRV